MIPRSFIPFLRIQICARARARSFNSNVFFSHLTVLAAVENGLVCGTRDLHVRACGVYTRTRAHHREPLVAFVRG